MLGETRNAPRLKLSLRLTYRKHKQHYAVQTSVNEDRTGHALRISTRISSSRKVKMPHFGDLTLAGGMSIKMVNSNQLQKTKE
jgi:hypothetical protein